MRESHKLTPGDQAVIAALFLTRGAGNKAPASPRVSGRSGAVTNGSQNIRGAIQQSVRYSCSSKADSVREVSHMQNSPDSLPQSVCSCRHVVNACTLGPFERGRLRLLMRACRQGMERATTTCWMRCWRWQTTSWIDFRNPLGQFAQITHAGFEQCRLTKQKGEERKNHQHLSTWKHTDII